MPITELPEFDILSADYCGCPEKHYPHWLASGCALALPFRVLCVTKYLTARDVYADGLRFASDAVWRFFESVNGTSGGPLGIPLVSLDDPEHGRLRAVVRPAFDQTRSADFEQSVRSIVRNTIESLAGGDTPVEVNSQLISPFIFRAMFYFFGIERRVEIGKLTAWSESVRAPFSLMPEAEREAVIRAQSETATFLQDCIDADLAQENSILGLVQRGIKRGDCTATEGLDLCRFLFYAGNQTTRLSLSSTLKILAMRTDLLERLRENPSLIPAFLHECLRLESATQLSLRSARERTKILGHTLEEGDFLFIHNACANRDPAVFENADELDLGRHNVQSHLTFGQGFHRCLGQQIAFKEMTCLLEELIPRVRRITLAPDKSFSYSPSMFLRGPEYLRLRLAWK